MVRRSRRTYRIFALTVLAFTVVSCASSPDREEDERSARRGVSPTPTAFVVYPVEKVRPEHEVRSKNTAIVSLAGGEYEAMVVGVNGPAVLTGLKVVLPQPPAAGEDALRLAAYRIEYVPIERASQWFACTRGRWPDPLVPLRPRVEGEPEEGGLATMWHLEPPLSVPAGENRTLLLELYLPAGCRRDTDLSVELLTDAGPAGCAVKVRPWGFDLPRKPAFATAFGFSSPAVIGKHRELAPDSLDAAALVRDYLHLLARFRISVNSPYEEAVGKLDAEGILRFDWAGFDSVTGALLDGNLFADVPPASSFAIPRPPKGLSTDQVREWYRSVEAHLREKGWLDRGFVVIADEPMHSEYRQVKASAAVIKTAAPGIRTLVTEHFTRALEGVVDIWCPDLWALGDSIFFLPIAARWPYRISFDFQCIPPAWVYRNRAARGERAWLYTSLSAFALDYPNLFIDSDAQSQRAIPWLAFRYGMSGLLYWQTVFAYRQPGDPWSAPRTMMTNGEGNLLYPGTPEREGLDAHQPVPSLRLMILRDGMEDYEYLALLDRGDDGALAARLARMVAPSSLRWPHDVAVTALARGIAAKRLAASAP